MGKFVIRFAAAAAAFIMGGVTIAMDDPYLWLEEVEGEQALEWVRAQNKESLDDLTADSRFETLEAEALSILTSKARLANGQIRKGNFYNFWQDDTHIRGVWRRASVETYRAGAPEWETLIDFDALAEEEGENWVFGGVTCLSPEYRHCMVEMSRGGKDASVWREFDTQEKTFVEEGFVVPEAKSYLSWYDKDTLLLATDWGEGSLTTSGYPRKLRAWSRGGNIAFARPVMSVAPEDVWIFPIVERDGDKVHEFVLRGVSFFEREYFYKGADGEFEKLVLPLNADLEGVLDGRAIVSLRENWNYGGKWYEQGSIVALDLESGEAESVMVAAPNQAIEDVGIGKSNIIVQYLEDVSGKAARLVRKENGKWKRKKIKLPESGVISLVSVGGGTDDAVLSYENMTTPEAHYYIDAENDVEKLAETPAFYDASDVVVKQHFATSKDGTKVPYFVMGKKSVLEKGNAPTIQYGYGGFLAAILPAYYEDPARPQHGALAGLMWVSRGGVLVLSNIRGGAEYGPRWHEAALRENRQRSFDDFFAISEQLIERGVTSPDKLGIIGRSNGGLLMGAALTQRPDLYAAIDIGVPLFDMQRYHKLLAGASWIGEYGNPDIEEDWAYISEYSPYQKLKADAGYPKVLFYTSTKDDRVHPGHARKAAAKLADLGYEFYYYENIEGGHGGTANQDQLAFRTAIEYLYFIRQLMGDDG